jgi:DNA-binding XRE family transcriptional regulator
MNTRRLKNVLEKNLGPLTFGSFLRGARVSKDMSQTEMAKFLGISKSSLCDIEKGRQFVTPTLAAKIAKKCGLSIIVAVEASLNDQLRRAGLNLISEVKAS